MKYLLCTAMAALAWATPVWAHEPPPAPAAQAGQTVPGTAKLDAHTQEDVQRHRSMAQAHEQAAQCLAQGRAHDDCQKQLQAACKGLALGKNCGMRHAH